MTTQAIQAEIQQVIEILNQARRSNQTAYVQTAIDRLIKLKEGVVSESTIRGFPGSPPAFHKDDQY